MQPGPYLKAVPLLLLGMCRDVDERAGRSYTECTIFLRIGFGIAGLGDFFLDGDSNVVVGTLLFCLTNLLFGVDFMLDNYYMHIQGRRSANNWVIFEDVLSKPMLIVAGISSVTLFFITPNWLLFFLFSTYSLCISFAFFQSLTLLDRFATKLSMFLFILSDLLVLMQFVKFHELFEPHIARILHLTDLLLYWTAMFGIRVSYMC